MDIKREQASVFSVKNTVLFFVCAGSILIVTIFFTLQYLQQKNFLEQEHLTTTLRDDINRHLESNFRSTCRALSQQQAVLALFPIPTSFTTHRATLLLNSSREILGANIIYILDRTGKVIASSFTENGDTLFGNNYQFRPYFSESIQGEDYIYAALGVTTGKRGIYFSSPIKDNNSDIVGVAVIKNGLESIDKIVLKAANQGPVIVFNNDGVVFVASEDSWLFHTAKQISPKKRQILIQSGQFATAELEPLSFDLNDEEVFIDGNRYTVHTQQLTLHEWSVATLMPKHPVLPAVIIVCLIFTVPAYFFFLKVKHFHEETGYKDKIHRQNIHLKRLNEEMKKEIEERKETEQALKRVSQLELQYRMLFEQSKDAITIVSEDGQFLEANQAFLSLMECRREDIWAMRPVDFWLSEQERRNWLKLIKEKGSVTDYHSKQKTKKGNILDLNLTTNATTTEEGSIVYLTILRDITKKLEDEKKLLIAKNEAEQASLAKSNFLANMSHEIRTPMNGIIGMTNIVLESTLTDEQRSYLTMVRSSADRLLDIINNILDFSKIEAGRLELEEVAFDIRDKCDELLSLMALKARNSNVTLTLSIGRDVPHSIIGDSTRLMQILINLTNNAIKFSNNGEVSIAVEANKVRPPNIIPISIKVRDTGIGVAKDKQAAIFESFAQADISTTRKYGGTGLGLTISSQLCRLMGGNIGLESKQGEGALFWFTIPFRLPESFEPFQGFEHGKTMSSTLSRNERFKTIHILLAEDDHINRTLAIAVLEKASLNVTAVANGLEVVEESAARRFDLILMDIQMPEMDGYEATRAIRRREQEHSRHTPIIAMTAHAIKGDREKCLLAGMDDYITKPIDASELYMVIERHLLQRVLVADDELQSLESTGQLFTEMGWQVTLAKNIDQCFWECRNSTFDLIMVELDMVKLSIEELCSIITKRTKETGKRTALRFTATSEATHSEEKLLVGVENILIKPLSRETLAKSMSKLTAFEGLNS
jgi:PAS domain S-box-containing protein